MKMFSVNEVNDFRVRFDNGEWPHQRFGQAFCNHFQTHLLPDGWFLEQMLWNASRDTVEHIISNRIKVTHGNHRRVQTASR